MGGGRASTRRGGRSGGGRGAESLVSLAGETLRITRSARGWRVTLTAWIPTEDRSEVIGKQGASVQKLEAQFNTKVSLVKIGGGGSGGGGGGSVGRRGGSGNSGRGGSDEWRATAREGELWWPLEITGKFSDAFSTLSAVEKVVDELDVSVVLKFRPPRVGGGRSGGESRRGEPIGSTLTKQWMARRISLDSGSRITTPSRGAQGGGSLVLEGTIAEVRIAFALVTNEVEGNTYEQRRNAVLVPLSQPKARPGQQQQQQQQQGQQGQTKKKRGGRGGGKRGKSGGGGGGALKQKQPQKAKTPASAQVGDVKPRRRGRRGGAHSRDLKPKPAAASTAATTTSAVTK